MKCPACGSSKSQKVNPKYKPFIVINGEHYDAEGYKCMSCNKLFAITKKSYK